MIESLHPLAIAAVVAGMPVAAVALSAGADYFAHRYHEQHPAIAPPVERERAGQIPSPAGNAEAYPTLRRFLPRRENRKRESRPGR